MYFMSGRRSSIMVPLRLPSLFQLRCLTRHLCVCAHWVLIESLAFTAAVMSWNLPNYAVLWRERITLYLTSNGRPSFWPHSPLIGVHCLPTAGFSPSNFFRFWFSNRNVLDCSWTQTHWSQLLFPNLQELLQHLPPSEYSDDTGFTLFKLITLHVISCAFFKLESSKSGAVKVPVAKVGIQPVLLMLFITTIIFQFCSIFDLISACDYGVFYFDFECW